MPSDFKPGETGPGCPGFHSKPNLLGEAHPKTTQWFPQHVGTQMGLKLFLLNSEQSRSLEGEKRGHTSVGSHLGGVTRGCSFLGVGVGKPKAELGLGETPQGIQKSLF